MDDETRNTINQHLAQAQTRERGELTSSSQTLNASRLQSLIDSIKPVADEALTDLFECVECKDVGWVYAEDGSATRCDCRLDRIRKERERAAIAITPTLYREKFKITNGLASIEADAKIHPDHPATLAMLKRNTTRSFYFYGKTGTHKTAFSWALVQEAGKLGVRTGGATARTLADNLRAFAFERQQIGSFYSLEQLRSTDRFCLLIDEIELFPVTEYSLTTLFELIDAVQTYEQQLLITSNKSLTELVKRWIAVDREGKANAVDYAEKILRRLTEICVQVDLT